MKILLVDDSTTTRAMVRRALRDLPETEIAEAANGLEALTEIARHRFDLVILDINMPVMGGLETLEAIRSSPRYAALPVVIVTSERSDALVRRLVEIGISDFLSKPLSVDTLAERLSRIISRLRAPVAQRRPGLVAGRNLRVLVVELDPDRRHFATTVLAPHYEVTDTDSAAAALRICMEPAAKPVDVVLLGEQIGLPPVPMFLSKLRTLPLAMDARVIAALSRSEMDSGRSLGFADHSIEWANVPEVFLARFERAARGDGEPTSGMALFRMTLEHDAVCATEQLFGLMLSSEVVLVGAGAAPVRPWPGTGVHARIDLRADDGAALCVLFRADDESARAVTARLLGMSPADVIEADVAATAGEFANIIVGRLRNRMYEAGLETRMQLPGTWFGEGPTDCATPDVALEFDLRELQASFGLVLQVHDPAAAGAPPAAAGTPPAAAS